MNDLRMREFSFDEIHGIADARSPAMQSFSNSCPSIRLRNLSSNRGFVSWRISAF
jgi:hypothetical protein